MGKALTTMAWGGGLLAVAAANAAWLHALAGGAAGADHPALAAALLADAAALLAYWKTRRRRAPARRTLKTRSGSHALDKLPPARSRRPIVYTDNFLVAKIPSVLCVKDAKGRWLKAKPAYLDFFNLRECAYEGRTNAELALEPEAEWDALDFDAQQDAAALALDHSRKDPANHTLKAGGRRYDILRIPIHGRDGTTLRLLVTGDSRKNKDSVRSRIFPAMFFSSHICFLLLDAEFKIILVNKAFLQLTGFAEADCLHGGLFFLGYEKSGGQQPDIAAFFQGHPGEMWSAELVCRRKNGEAMPVKVLVSALKVPGADKSTPYYIANMYDITAQKSNENRILRLAHYDDLTGLPNRIMFLDHLAKILAGAGRQGVRVAVLFLDLDRFKLVNDAIGHQAGNALLREVAERIRGNVEEEHLVARLSGDEFAILSSHAGSYENAAAAAAATAQAIIADISKSFQIQRRNVFVGVSIGIAIFPEDAGTSEELLRSADMAMYEAKRQGRNSHQFFNTDYVKRVQERNHLETGLRDALANRELELNYQPQHAAGSRALCGAEVLLRWFHGDGQPIPPDLFIPVAEDIGVINAIGKWILETACKQHKAWLDAGLKLPKLSVNVSARQFLEPNFAGVVEGALQLARLEPGRLELEITESMLIGEPGRIEPQLAELKRLGVSIALDDFGTGYSSLSYLSSFPIDTLKIDKSFIRGLREDTKEARIVRAIIDIGHSLGQQVVAEGVETEEQYLYLLENGCDIVQGYYFSRPLSVAEMSGTLMRAG